jgi:ankyrin repeat domain-containing protein 50
LTDNSVKLVNLSDEIKRQEIEGKQKEIDNKRREIINWLWPCDPSTNHSAAQAKHEPGTGSWFIESKDFTDWKENNIRSLWLQGIPGAGKTILCSTIIHQIGAFCSTQDGYAYAYFYFDFNDRQKQIVDSFLRSAIIQLFTRRSEIPDDLLSMYRQSHGSQLGREALIGILLSLFKFSPRSYILIDALDECSDRIDAVNVLRRLINTSDSVSLLVTSRKEQDIISVLQPHIDVVLPIQNAKVNVDVAIHVRQCLDNDPTLWRCESVKSEVVKTLVDGADGMYALPTISVNI